MYSIKVRLGLSALAVLGAAALATGSLGSARASHDHWLQTPGTCVEDLGSGQTAIGDPAAGGYHQIHENVHLGVPGAVAFENANNPVSIGKLITVPCP